MPPTRAEFMPYPFNLFISGDGSVSEWFIGLGAGGLTGLIVYRFLASFGKQKNKTVFHPDDMLSEQAERRASPRKKVQGVFADLAVSENLKPQRVKVMDISFGGLSVLAKSQLPVGIQMYIRPYQDGKTHPWSPILVCDCQSAEDGWTLHCKFLKPPPANVMPFYT